MWGLCRAFVSTHPLIHKHVKMSVGKWIMETTHPHKYVNILGDHIFFCFALFAMIISKLYFIEIIEHFRIYN